MAGPSKGFTTYVISFDNKVEIDDHPDDEEFNVFWADFESQGDRDHRGIFVSVDLAKPGYYFHVHGRQRLMQYEEKKNYEACNSKNWLRVAEVGKVKGSDLKRLQEVCRSIAPPHTKVDIGERRPPDCQDWVTFVTHELIRTNVVEQKSTFGLPSKPITLHYD